MVFKEHVISFLQPVLSNSNWIFSSLILCLLHNFNCVIYGPYWIVAVSVFRSDCLNSWWNFDIFFKISKSFKSQGLKSLSLAAVGNVSIATTLKLTEIKCANYRVNILVIWCHFLNCGGFLLFFFFFKMHVGSRAKI